MKSAGSQELLKCPRSEKCFQFFIHIMFSHVHWLPSSLYNSPPRSYSGRRWMRRTTNLNKITDFARFEHWVETFGMTYVGIFTNTKAQKSFYTVAHHVLSSKTHTILKKIEMRGTKLELPDPKKCFHRIGLPSVGCDSDKKNCEWIFDLWLDWIQRRTGGAEWQCGTFELNQWLGASRLIVKQGQNQTQSSFDFLFYTFNVIFYR